MATVRRFASRRSCEPEENEYCINKIGEIFIAYPAKDPWAPVRQVIGTFSEDFIADRNQPSWDSVPPRVEF